LLALLMEAQRRALGTDEAKELGEALQLTMCASVAAVVTKTDFIYFETKNRLLRVQIEMSWETPPNKRQLKFTRRF
jgi:hypothetical protein